VTSVVLKPDRVGAIRVLRDVRPPGLGRPFLAASVEYPLPKALNEWEPIRTLIEDGRFTLEVGDNLFPVHLFGAPVAHDADQSGSSWTKVLDQTKTEAKTRFGIDRRCIALLNTYDASNALCRLVTDDLLKEIDSKLRARPCLIDGLGGLVLELMPGMRLTMDASPPARVLAPLPFDLKFQPERGLILEAPEAAFARSMEVAVFFRPVGNPYSFQLGVANSVEIGPSDMREWRQFVSWPGGAQTARAVVLFQGHQIEEISFDCLPDSTAHVQLAKGSRNAGSALEGDDRRFAQMAIEEALKSVSEDDRPHPKVGAVVVKGGRVLSKAHRGEIPKCHAEYIALEQKLADDLVAGATVYTTLEPCTTRKHPKIPCAERLVERKVSRVIIGMLDPNPDIRGQGELLLLNLA